MDAITTLSQFLNQAGTQFQVFDLGRRVQPLDPILFNQIENGMLPYPSPRNGYAWLGILFWQAAAAKQHYVWFLKLPLDERGLINPAARNQFLQMVIEALGQDPAAHLSQEQEQRLANNPFTFAPTPEKMALFNALVRKQLVQPASVHFEAVQQYVAGQYAWSQWQQLGLQGFADLAVRQQSLTTQQWINAIEYMPFEPLSALGSVMEHTELNDEIAQPWFARWQQATDEPEQLCCLRALAGSAHYAQLAVQHILAQPKPSQESLIVIAARLWQALDQHTMPLYMEHIAQYSGQVFNQLYRELVAIPGQRAWVLTCLRQPKRSAPLERAVTELIHSIQGAKSV